MLSVSIYHPPFSSNMSSSGGSGSSNPKKRPRRASGNSSFQDEAKERSTRQRGLLLEGLPARFCLHGAAGDAPVRTKPKKDASENQAKDIDEKNRKAEEKKTKELNVFVQAILGKSQLLRSSTSSSSSGGSGTSTTNKAESNISDSGGSSCGSDESTTCDESTRKVVVRNLRQLLAECGPSFHLFAFWQ